MKDIDDQASKGQAHPLAGFAGLFADVVEHLRKSTVEVFLRGRGGGTGVIWRRDGMIITNDHVVAGSHAKIRLADGRVFDATLTRRDQSRDLAALSIPADDLPAATIGDSGRLRAGEIAFAVGNPLGQVGALNIGVIHAVDERWIRADVRLAPGNSGGPLVNAKGEVVGINSLIARGLAHAIPSLLVERFLARPGGAARARLGVSFQPVSVGLRRGSRLGLLLLEVERGSAAERSGLQIGDILLGVGSRPIRSPEAVSGALDRIDGAGDSLDLELLRGGQWMRITADFSAEKGAAEAA
jgi:serine protease Do